MAQMDTNVFIGVHWCYWWLIPTCYFFDAMNDIRYTKGFMAMVFIRAYSCNSWLVFLGCYVNKDACVVIAGCLFNRGRVAAMV